MDANEARRLLRRLAALAGAVVLLSAIGCDGTDETTETDDALACPPGGSVHDDAADDVRLLSSSGPAKPSPRPSADLISVTVRRGEGGVVCVAFRTAGPVREGSTFALTTRQADGAGEGWDEQRYEVQLDPDGTVNVSRPHGEPRYPVRADVEQDGAVLRVAMETLLRPEAEFDWRADSSYLPDFPLGRVYVDAIPDGEGWLRFPVTRGASRP